MGPQIVNWIVKGLEFIAGSVKTTREAMADTVEEIASKIRSGDLIADEAFKQWDKDHDAFDKARDALPD